MSQEEQAAGLSRKEKRALRDAERSEKTKKGKKRKIEEANEPADENEAYAPELEADFIALPKIDEKDAKPTPSSAVSKKRKQAQPQPSADGETATAQPAAKKRRKATKTKPQDGEEGGDEATKPANQRFIVFVGNLPYATTDDSLRTHFASLQPFTLRHRTDPKTKKSKGFAFLEFENFDRMKTCLKLYHHSYFDPESPEKSKLAGQGEDEQPQLDQGFRARGKKPKEKGRKINVELTAGGGGGGGERMEKIRVKNVRLEEQRQRRKEAEKKEKVRKEKKGGGKDGEAEEKLAEEGSAGAGANEGMHPSRLAMMGRK